MAIRRSMHVAVSCGLVALLAVTTVGVSDAVPSEGELGEAREQASELGGEGERARDELAQAVAALEVLEGCLALRQDELDVALGVHRGAERAVVEAATRARAAESELSAASERLADHERSLASLVRDAHRFGLSSASATLAAVELFDGDAGTLGDRLHYLSRSMGAPSVSIEQAAALRIELGALTDRVRLEEAELREREREAETVRDRAAEPHAEMMDLVSEQSTQIGVL